MTNGSNAEYDVALCGYFGFGNLGDELLAASAIEHLCNAGIARHKIVLLSNAPSESRKKFGVEAVDRWSLRTVKSVFAASKSVLFAGGGLFQDVTSVKSCVYYWGLVRLARMACRPVWALGQSVGPLRTKLGLFFAKNALSRVDYLAVRDEPSMDALKEMGIDNAVFMPDLVAGLSIPQVEPLENGPVLVNVRPCAGKTESLAELSRAISILREKGVEMRGIAMSREDADEFSRQGASFEVRTPQTVEEFAEFADGCSCALGMRLHFAVLSAFMGLPVTVSPYDPKVASFAREFGLGFVRGAMDSPSSDIMNILTNVPIQDKRKMKNIKDNVEHFVREGLNHVTERLKNE